MDLSVHKNFKGFEDPTCKISSTEILRDLVYKGKHTNKMSFTEISKDLCFRLDIHTGTIPENCVIVFIFIGGRGHTYRYNSRKLCNCINFYRVGGEQ